MPSDLTAALHPNGPTGAATNIVLPEQLNDELVAA
jgi:hypothetical protein